MSIAVGSDGSTPLIGRDRDIVLIRSVLARVVGGAPAAAAGFVTLTGRASEFGRDTAYAPVIEAVGPWLRELSTDRRDALTADLPQLGLLFSGLGITPPAPLSHPALGRSRIEDGLALLLDRLTRERPVALLVDDVHAADPGTIAFLHHTARGWPIGWSADVPRRRRTDTDG